jgi:hypothetical protein
MAREVQHSPEFENPGQCFAAAVLRLVACVFEERLVTKSAEPAR